MKNGELLMASLPSVDQVLTLRHGSDGRGNGFKVALKNLRGCYIGLLRHDGRLCATALVGHQAGSQVDEAVD